MSKNYDLTGLNSALKFGQSGPELQINDGNYSINTPGGSVSNKRLKVRTPVQANDIVDYKTQQLDLSRCLSFFYNEFPHTETGDDLLGRLDTNQIAIKLTIYVWTAMNGTGPTLKVGWTVGGDEVIDTTYCDLTAPGIYTKDLWIPHNQANPTDTYLDLRAWLDAPGATEGQFDIQIDYFTKVDVNLTE